MREGKPGACGAPLERSDREVRCVRLAALRAEVAEAELFGYKIGAFPGVKSAMLGRFLAADRGTLFLDEVLELPIQVQVKLLRAIVQRSVLPLGETQAVPVDVRVIAAAQGSLIDAVAGERFRADLHGHLGLTLILPPLRERREDIAPLFLHLLRQERTQHPNIDPELIEALCMYDFPLNVRELALLASQLVSLHGHEPIRPRDRPKKAHLLESSADNPSLPATRQPDRWPGSGTPLHRLDKGKREKNEERVPFGKVAGDKARFVRTMHGGQLGKGRADRPAARVIVRVLQRGLPSQPKKNGRERPRRGEGSGVERSDMSVT